jgi:uncharacterized repeat protein (TIGR04076 family)
MCQHREDDRVCLDEDRREFCRLTGSLALGLMAAGGVTAMGCERSSPASVHLAVTKIAERQDNMAEKVTAVTAKVVSQRGTCAFGHKVGDTTRITEAGVEGRICIHALYSMFPAAFAMLYDVKFPWLSNTETKTHPCTDAQNPVVFELTKVRT